jgi:hypothetical protein
MFVSQANMILSLVLLVQLEAADEQRHLGLNFRWNLQ